MYKCINHLEKFYFRDATLNQCEYKDGIMTWELEGAVARYNNPANETMVDRYVDAMQIRLKGAGIRRMFLEGAKYYDANGALLEEAPDTDIPGEEYEKILKALSGGIVFMVRMKEPDVPERLRCEIAVDVTDEEEEQTDTYWIEVEFDRAVSQWGHFLNKAMLE